MTIHIIVAAELAIKTYECVNRLIEKEDCLSYVSHKEEVYWKDDSMLDIYYEIGVKNPITETEWIQLFDQCLKHNDISKNNSFLEIDHYSEVGNCNDPFVIAYIPLISVKE